MKRAFLFLSCLLIWCNSAFAQTFHTIQDGPLTVYAAILNNNQPNTVVAQIHTTQIDLVINGTTHQFTNLQSFPISLSIVGGNLNDHVTVSGTNLNLDNIVFGGMDGDDYFENQSSHRSDAFGGKGLDILIGGSGVDFLYGEDDADILAGGPGEDGLYGGWGDDILMGEEHNDILDGMHGFDQMYGGEDDDTLYDSYPTGPFGQGDVIPDNNVDLMVGGAGADAFQAFYGTYSVQFGQQMFYYSQDNFSDFDANDQVSYYWLSEHSIKTYLLPTPLPMHP